MRFAVAEQVQAGVRRLLHGVIVERDSESRELLVRVLAGLDWSTDAFNALPDAEPYLAGAWAIFVGCEHVDDAADQTLARLRGMAPDTVIAMILPAMNEAHRKMLKRSGADIVFVRPLNEPAVIDAVGRALVHRRT